MFRVAVEVVGTYLSTTDHAFGDLFAEFLVLGFAFLLGLRAVVGQVGFKEFDVATIRKSRIGIVGDLSVRIKVLRQISLVQAVTETWGISEI